VSRRKERWIVEGQEEEKKVKRSIRVGKWSLHRG
jgi:hypothetical protein